MTAAPYLGAFVFLGLADTAIKFSRCTTIGDIALPATGNSMARAGDIILVAVNSSASGTGRVRGFTWDYGRLRYTEVPEVSDLFDDWNAIPTHISASPVISDSGNPAQVYEAAIEALLSNTVDLDNIKIALVSSELFDGTDTTLIDALGGNEVYGSSWPQGGIAANAMTVEGVSGGAALVLTIPPYDLTDAGTLSFRAAIVYDDTHADKRPIAFIDFGETKTATQFDRMTFTSPGGRLIVFKRDEGA